MKKYLLISILFLFQFSCVTEKKARSRAIEFYREHPAELAQTCADKFPIGTQYIKGFTIVKKDTTINRAIFLNCPETINPETKTSYVPQVKCPELQTIYIETIRVDTFKKDNPARVEQYRLEKEDVEKKYAVIEADLKATKNESQQRLYLIIILSALVGLSIYLRIKK
ncbi:hypothetical protein [Arcicella rosea]|uniref:Uncharacterized protein n=1 Tax=Arcicella rosea TaxID=502909 RepID=A0A841ER36_9BACT|nr:hypothetical protein [Arcicella rosea]MBB6003839.1 hypothetical protein [Arcicella rosea]